MASPFCCPLVAGQHLVVLPSRGLHTHETVHGGDSDGPVATLIRGALAPGSTAGKHPTDGTRAGGHRSTRRARAPKTALDGRRHGTRTLLSVAQISPKSRP